MTAGVDPEPSDARELTEFLGKLTLSVILASACVAAPAATALWLRPWVGILVAIGAFWVWGRFGPPPMPGFLSGTLCLSGYAAILGSLILCIALAVR